MSFAICLSLLCSGLLFGGFAATAGIAGAGTLATAFADSEADDGLHAPHFHWNHTGMLGAFDHFSIRRGHQVYQQVRGPPSRQGDGERGDAADGDQRAAYKASIPSVGPPNALH